MQCLPILFNHFSSSNQPLFLFLPFSRILFSFSPRGSYLGPPCLPSLSWISPHRPPGCLPPRFPEFLSPLSISRLVDCFQCSPFQMCNPCKLMDVCLCFAVSFNLSLPLSSVTCCTWAPPSPITETIVTMCLQSQAGRPFNFNSSIFTPHFAGTSTISILPSFPFPNRVS